MAWAVVGQVASLGVLVDAALRSKPAQASIVTIPGQAGPPSSDHGNVFGAANATGDHAYAIGQCAIAAGAESIAIGRNAEARANFATALGFRASA